MLSSDKIKLTDILPYNLVNAGSETLRIMPYMCARGNKDFGRDDENSH